MTSRCQHHRSGRAATPLPRLVAGPFGPAPQFAQKGFTHG